MTSDNGRLAVVFKKWFFLQQMFRNVDVCLIKTTKNIYVVCIKSTVI